jgi:hypothetical protein
VPVRANTAQKSHCRNIKQTMVRLDTMIGLSNGILVYLRVFNARGYIE